MHNDPTTKNPYGSGDLTNPKDRLGMKKPPLHLIPQTALIHEAMGMWTGAVSYGPFNWRERHVLASVYIAAARRHEGDWWDGEEFADDGVHHLGHARCCHGIILDAQAHGALIDDRPPRGASHALLKAYASMMECVIPQLIYNDEGMADRSQVDWVRAHRAYYDRLKAETGRDVAGALLDSIAKREAEKGVGIDI